MQRRSGQNTTSERERARASVGRYRTASTVSQDVYEGETDPVAERDDYLTCIYKVARNGVTFYTCHHDGST